MEDKKVPLNQPTALQRLINEPKGKIEYCPTESFILHVFWETPSLQAAEELLSGLSKCAVATHRDTPCVPTYFFRISNVDAEICSPPPRTIGDHPAIREAIKKLRVGTPRGAVVDGLVRKGVDPKLLDADESAPLPAELQQQPVAVECTEVYLDERAFMEHAGSRDYLDAYGIVIKPSMQNRPPQTTRLGTPVPSLITKILDPILKENVAPLTEGCTHVWRQPTAVTTPISISVDIASEKASEALHALSPAFREHCTTLLSFPHLVRQDTTRILCVLPSIPPSSVLSSLATLHPLRGEAFSKDEAVASTLRTALSEAGLSTITVTTSNCVGYILHERAAELRQIQKDTIST